MSYRQIGIYSKQLHQTLGLHAIHYMETVLSKRLKRARLWVHILLQSFSLSGRRRCPKCPNCPKCRTAAISNLQIFQSSTWMAEGSIWTFRLKKEFISFQKEVQTLKSVHLKGRSKPWLGDWMCDKNFCKELLKMCTRVQRPKVLKLLE